MNRYKLILSYQGDNFKGFQVQSFGRTVQADLINFINKIFGDVKMVYPAGRTDSGVHAQGQVIHFESKKTISPYKAKYSLNSVLPDDIRILSFENISSDFNARKAKSRVYYYLFTPYENIPLYMTKYLTFINFLPNESLFQKIEKLIVGYNNFINFVKKGSYEKTTFRTIFHISISKKKIKSLYQSCEAYYYEFHIVADGFLYRMVRNLVGAFFEVISERQSFSSFQDFFLGKISDFRYHAAPAKGLCLTKVNY